MWPQIIHFLLPALSLSHPEINQRQPCSLSLITPSPMGYSLTPIPVATATPLSDHHRHSLIPRRSLLLSTTLSLSLSLPPPPSLSSPLPDTTITDRIFMDFSLCPTNSFPCSDSVPLGRLILGLYGRLVPITVSNFKSMCTGSSGSSYKGTLVHKIFPGQFFLAGRQGRRDKGEVRPPLKLARNIESVNSGAFVLGHSRGGIVSLCLSENDDEDEFKLDPDYHNVEFLITTGPGPCPQLDSKNIVFGTVLEGLDVVTAIASIPTYKPSERIRQFNDLAEFLGDERAQNARSIWNRPLKTLYIADCGEFQVAKPSLPPTLP